MHESGDDKPDAGTGSLGHLWIWAPGGARLSPIRGSAGCRADKWALRHGHLPSAQFQAVSFGCAPAFQESNALGAQHGIDRL